MNYARSFTALTAVYLICNALWECILSVISTSHRPVWPHRRSMRADCYCICFVSGCKSSVIVFVLHVVTFNSVEGVYSRKESLLPLTPPFKLLLPLMSCFLLQPGSSLEQTHIFVLAHILRRPIIVYGVKYYKSFRGETLGYTRFQGEQPVSGLDGDLVRYHEMCECSLTAVGVEALDFLCETAPAYMSLHSWHSWHNCPSDLSVIAIYNMFQCSVCHLRGIWALRYSKNMNNITKTLPPAIGTRLEV